MNARQGMRAQSLLSGASESQGPHQVHRGPASRPGHSPTCTICGKTYARIDHLERHARSHTQLKPFACRTCGKSFARVDALKRHEGNHDAPAAKKRKTSKPTRSRAGKACNSCAASKLKCEDDKPCARCRQKGISCVYATTPPPSPHRDRSGAATSYSLPPSNISIAAVLAASDGLPPEEPVQPYSPDPAMVDIFGESSLAYFLNDVMLPMTPALDGQHIADEQANQNYTQRDFLDFGTSWADLAEFEAMLSGHDAETYVRPTNVSFNVPPPPSGTKTPVFGDSFGMRNAAFSRSIWRWIPTKKDHGGAEQLNLSLPYSDMNSPETRSVADTLLPNQSIDQTLRDKLLALILSTCDQAMYPEIVMAFPSAELLNGLMHYSLNTHFAQIDSWIHVPSLMIEENLELLIMVIAAGAVISSVAAIRKLGFALQEAARSALANKFESDNRFTRDLGCIQGLVLGLQIGLWSGDKRKMEIAESFAQPPITMMRRGGRFSRRRSSLPPPTIEDSEELLLSKWREWVQAESYKRLAIHLLIHDAQASMAQQVSPLISPSEMTLDLPSARELWCANNARDWRDIYFRIGIPMQEKSLSIAQSISHVSQIRDQPELDVSLAAMVVVHSVWTAVWNHSQLNALVRSQLLSQALSGPTLLASSSWDNGVPQLLETLRLIFSDWNGLFRPEMALGLERTLLSLHVSFEQVQLFAGKEGEEEARRAFPILRQWSSTSDARKAVWHAGQVLRAARQCPPKHLRDFQALCLYHAGMTFWTYAVVSASGLGHQQSQAETQPRATPSLSDSELVWLDGGDDTAVQRFIALNRGSPVISNQILDSRTGAVQTISLGNPKAIMDVCIELLRRNSPVEGDGTPLPLVENLSQLMRDLGNAAHELLQGSLRRSKETQTDFRA